MGKDEEYREKFSYEIFKMYLQKLGRDWRKAGEISMETCFPHGFIV